MILKNKLLYIVVLLLTFSSCEEWTEKYPLPEANSIADATPPKALFGFSQKEGFGDDDFKEYTFANLSEGATQFSWNFGDGNTSIEKEPIHIFPDEGIYSVSLTVIDGNEVTATFTEDIEVKKPDIPAVLDPVLVNAEFERIDKSTGSPCACSGWINRDLSNQAESTTASGNSVVKFDNDEHDAIYQEFEVAPNTNYSMRVSVGFDAALGGSFPSILEVRVLAGTGYESGYSPTYYTEAIEFPISGFGYTSVAQMEDATNNIVTETVTHPETTAYRTYEFKFNSGANGSLALFMRGIGGDGTPNDDKGFAYNSGDEEIQIDSINIIVDN